MQEEEYEGIELGEGFASADPENMDAAAIIEYDDDEMKYRVHADLADRMVPIGDLVQWPINPNNGDIERIAKSLKDHGQFRAIGVNRGTYSKEYEPNTIAYGNHTYQAALSNGWTHIAVTWMDVEDAEFDEIAMVDNNASAWSWMDQAAAYAVLSKDGVDPERAGSSDAEMQLMAKRHAESDSPPPGEFESLDGTEAAHECPSCGYRWG